MRITNVLFRQHIGFMTKRHWRIQGKRTPTDSGALAALEARGIKVTDTKEFLYPTPFKNREQLSFVGPLELPPKLDETHPHWNSRKCHLYGDNNVLLEGIQQAQVLLKTLVFNEYPEKIEEMLKKINLPTDLERSMQQSVLVSHLLDAQQEKTAIIKDPERPSRVFKRNYGITDIRKNQLLAMRLLLHCERFAGHLITKDRKIINDAFFVVPIEKEGDLIQFEVLAETFVTSKKPTVPVSFRSGSEDMVIPSIFPLKHTVSIPTLNLYQKRNIYPIRQESNYGHPHTILLHYSPLEVKNIHESPVSKAQFESRAMLKAFSVAAAKAQQLYGNDVKDLASPIVVQVVHLNKSKLQFGVYQLNTLDLDGSEGTKNYWFTKPELELYEECLYKVGRPTMTGYNRDVFRHMCVFYNNQ